MGEMQVRREQRVAYEGSDPHRITRTKGQNMCHMIYETGVFF